MPFLSMMPEQLETFRSSEVGGSIVIAHLMKFKSDGGRELFDQYEKNTKPLVDACGGRVRYKGSVISTMVGRAEWDRFTLIEYPSRRVFLELIGSDEFLREDFLRIDAIEDMRMFCIQDD